MKTKIVIGLVIVSVVSYISILTYQKCSVAYAKWRIEFAMRVITSEVDEADLLIDTKAGTTVSGKKLDVAGLKKAIFVMNQRWGAEHDRVVYLQNSFEQALNLGGSK